jgi:hypothetical protein
MLGSLKNLFGSNKPKETWQETIQRLAKKLVPLSGDAETLQGELVRCVNNLADEATRNGWMNWDIGDEESIETLRRYLPDAKVFSESVQKEIHSALDKVRYAGEKGADEGKLGYEEIEFIARHVAEWCNRQNELIYKNPKSIWLDENPFAKLE